MRASSKLTAEGIAFVALLLAYVVYGSLYIFRTSFVIEGERYFSLSDDAMIAMTYARNLATGHGLVWNPGDAPVEGYSDPLWVLFMALVHLLPVAASKVSLLVQVSSLALLAANLFVVRKLSLALSGGSSWVALGAVFLTAFFLPLNTWGLQGFEVGALALVTSIACLLATRACEHGRVNPWLFVLLGLGTWLRMDAIVIAAAIISVLFFAMPSERWRVLRCTALVFMPFILVQEVLRVWYYGDLLSNTYYLKLTGFPILLRITRGLYATYQWVWQMTWPLFFLPLSILVFRRDKVVVLFFSVVVAQLAYNVYAGGDFTPWWSYATRYVSVVVPVFFVLFSYAVYSLLKLLARARTGPGDDGDKGRRIEGWVMAGVFVVFLLGSQASFNSIYGRQALLELALITPPWHVAENKRNVVQALLIDRVTDPHARVAVEWAGAIPYFMDRYAIDTLGKSDRVIAHGPAHVEGGPLGKFISFAPGHTKWDYEYSIKELKPDVITSLKRSPDDARPYWVGIYQPVGFQVGGLATGVLVRNDSSHVNWDAVSSLRQQSP